MRLRALRRCSDYIIDIAERGIRGAQRCVCRADVCHVYGLCLAVAYIHTPLLRHYVDIAVAALLLPVIAALLFFCRHCFACCHADVRRFR